jgi:Tol biopolymer transport system component
MHATDDVAAAEPLEPLDADMRTPSRDGARIVFARAEADDPDVSNLWLQPLEGGEAIRLTQYRSGRTGKPSWFPDNHRICYTHGTTIAVLDVYGGTPRTFESPVQGHAVSTPVVSADGSTVIFQVSQSGGWILDVANGTMKRLLTRD